MAVMECGLERLCRAVLAELGMSNILALPHALVTIETGNNEDWIEAFKFVVEDPLSAQELWPQLDLRGLEFEMEIRHKPEDHEVVLSASTTDLKLSIGAFPNYGFLLLNIPVEEMKTRVAGSYVADVVANDDRYVRKCMTITINLVEGVTR
jgi:hypothetical protein